MLGVQVLLLSAMAFIVGLEAGSPGCLLAMLKAFALVTVVVRDGTLGDLCTQLESLGRSVPACAAS